MTYSLGRDLGSRVGAAEVSARSGAYQLLLGAGASLGAVNRFGAIPKATELIAVLARRFSSAPITEGISLSRAYNRAVLASSPDQVWQFLREVFSNANHESWFVDLISLPWRRLWTLNVDDTVQNAYALTARAKTQKLRTISWDEPYSETGDFEVVHLHGHVLSKEPRNLIFSFSEYQTAAQARPVWDQMLGGVLATEPIVALGARLLDDPDIENLLMNNRPTSKSPSIVVDPFITDDNIWELNKLGYVVVKEKGREFVSAWRAQFGFDEASLADLYQNSTIDLPQLTNLESNRVRPAPRAHNYFSGDEPLWSDAVENRPALFGWMKKVIAGLEEWLDQPSSKSRVHILYVRRFAGISSGHYVIAKHARKFGVTVLEFDKSSRFNVDRVIDFCRGRGPVLLLIDGGSEFGDDIDRLARRAAEQDNVALYCLVSALPNEYLRLEGRLTGRYEKFAETIDSRLTREDARAISAKLDKFGRLGALEPLTTTERQAHFRGRDIFSGMMDVEQARGFRARTESELELLDREWKLDLVLLLALASKGNQEVSVAEAALAVGVGANIIVKDVEEDASLMALVEISGRMLFTRQRANAVSATVTMRGRAKSLDVLGTMIRAIAPLSTRQGLRDRNRSAVLVGQLMKAKSLAAIFGPRDLDQFYEGLRETFGDWNGRYWEQRAIHAKSQEDWALAESFAARAVSLYDDAFTRTTYGTILLNRAQDFARRGDATWVNFYERGRLEFDSAVDHQPENRITKFALLQALLAILETIVKGGTVHGETSEAHRLIADLATEWRAAYLELRITLTDETGFESVARAEELSERYQKLFGGAV